MTNSKIGSLAGYGADWPPPRHLCCHPPRQLRETAQQLHRLSAEKERIVRSCSASKICCASFCPVSLLLFTTTAEGNCQEAAQTQHRKGKRIKKAEVPQLLA
eukprot:1146366-Pelagomonas_calceolata.AAC.2